MSRPPSCAWPQKLTSPLGFAQPRSCRGVEGAVVRHCSTPSSSKTTVFASAMLTPWHHAHARPAGCQKLSHQKPFGRIIMAISLPHRRARSQTIATSTNTMIPKFCSWSVVIEPHGSRINTCVVVVPLGGRAAVLMSTSIGSCDSFAVIGALD